MRDTNPDQVFPIENYDAAVTALDSMIDKLTPDQAHIYNTVTQRVICSDKDTIPLFAFLSGQGGVGKSEVLKAQAEYEAWLQTPAGAKHMVKLEAQRQRKLKRDREYSRAYRARKHNEKMKEL